MVKTWLQIWIKRWHCFRICSCSPVGCLSQFHQSVVSRKCFQFIEFQPSDITSTHHEFGHTSGWVSSDQPASQLFRTASGNCFSMWTDFTLGSQKKLGYNRRRIGWHTLHTAQPEASSTFILRSFPTSRFRPSRFFFSKSRWSNPVWDQVIEKNRSNRLWFFQEKQNVPGHSSSPGKF